MLNVRKIIIRPYILSCPSTFELRNTKKSLSTTEVAKRHVGSINFLVSVLIVTLPRYDVLHNIMTKIYEKYERGEQGQFCTKCNFREYIGEGRRGGGHTAL